MKEFDEILSCMWGALMDAREMAMESVKHKTQYPDVAATYNRIANDRLTHVEMLRKIAADMRDMHRRDEDEDADEMTVILDHDNGRVTESLVQIKNIMAMYR